MKKTLLLCLLLCGAAGLRADEGDPAAAAPVPIPDAALIDGPAALSLGAEASLALPAGWRFVPREQLKAYWRDRGITPGAWDRGVVLPADSGLELRLVFEPLGAVPLEPLPQVDSLLLKAQGMAKAAQAGAAAGLGRELTYWRWEPFFQPDAMSLRFGGVWRQGTDETVSMHVRWLGRRGVLKLDWRGAEDNANTFSANVEQMEEGLRFNPGQSRAEATPKDPVSSIDLSGLVLDGLFGRGSLAQGPAVRKSLPWWAWALIAVAGVALLLVGIVQGWRGLAAWLDRRAKAKADAQRLAHLERSFGGSAEDVEEISEEEN